MEKQRLIIAARCAKEWVEALKKNKKPTQAFHQLLHSMSQQVIDSDGEKLAFNLTDVVDEVAKSESNSAHGKAFSKFEEKLEQFYDGLREFAIDSDFAFIPKVSLDKSERINVAKFSAVETPEGDIPRANEIPPGAIRYTFEEKHELWRLFGFISGLRLRTGPMIIAGIVLWLLIMGYFAVGVFLVEAALSVMSTNSLMGLAAYLLIGYFALRWLRAFDRFMTHRIALTHDALARISAPQSVVVMKTNLDNAPTLEVISAGSSCPVCGGVIRLRKPHFKSSHVVIGACHNNPTEHCFTFDHTTRLGWPITEAAQHKK
ncbi:hypothetical protein CWE21_10600 [Pseudidiomarina aquimaris]|uniref:Uncharacterized protein n=2 Tax=Pseudidiomarina aquimaris TaxID=641841 RepID=A0A432XDH1_9GAMM|nr:hypothetical protein CWE21_10600 [Pseudidiomarina aquimaris]